MRQRALGDFEIAAFDEEKNKFDEVVQAKGGRDFANSAGVNFRDGARAVETRDERNDPRVREAHEGVKGSIGLEQKLGGREPLLSDLMRGSNRQPIDQSRTRASNAEVATRTPVVPGSKPFQAVAIGGNAQPCPRRERTRASPGAAA